MSTDDSNGRLCKFCSRLLRIFGLPFAVNASNFARRTVAKPTTRACADKFDSSGRVAQTRLPRLRCAPPSPSPRSAPPPQQPKSPRPATCQSSPAARRSETLMPGARRVGAAATAWTVRGAHVAPPTAVSNVKNRHSDDSRRSRQAFEPADDPRRSRGVAVGIRARGRSRRSRGVDA